ncbi:MAG: hypothetical protein WDM77_18535 [Steroidobacteraceae bacterium]
MRPSQNSVQRTAADQSDDTCTAPTGLLAGRLLGAAVALLGLGSLLCDFLKLPQLKILNIHVLFGVVLLMAVARSLLLARPVPGVSGVDSFYFHTRRLARWVYGLLYLLAAVRICLYLVNNNESNRGPTMFNRFTTRGSVEDFQQYIGVVLLAICLIRLCAMLTMARASARHMA